MKLTGLVPTVRLDTRNRVLLWILLLLITASLLSFPVRLVCEYRPIQAPYIFENLPLFVGLFCTWMVVLLVLAMSKRDDANRSDGENVALAAAFGLVVWGLWVAITPYGSYADDLYNQAHVRWLMQEGTIPIGHKNLEYFDYPGLHLLVSAMSQISGLGVAASRTFFLLTNSLAFSALLYLYLERILRNQRLAFLGVLLIATGNIVLVEKMRVFTPGALGFTLLAGFLLVLTKSEHRVPPRAMPETLVMVTLFAAIVISYFANSFLVPLALMGILILQTMAQDDARTPVFSLVSLFVILVLAWAVYWTYHTFNSLTRFLPEMKVQILSGGFLETALKLGASNVGGSLPPWASVTHLAVWGILGLSTIVGLTSLLRVKTLSPPERAMTGALLGVIALFAIGTLGTEGGYQFVRFLMYAPLFAIPAALLFLARSHVPRVGVLAILSILTLVLALPSFLSSVNTVSTDALYASDIAGGTFLESHSTHNGASHAVYGTCIDSAALARYYVPDAAIKRVPEMVLYEPTQAAVWDKVNEFLAEFVEPDDGFAQQKLFIMNEKSAVPYRHIAGIPLDDPNWGRVNKLLAAEDRVYDNGHVEMYVPS